MSNIDKKYVDKNEAMLMLGVASHNFYKVSSAFGIRIINQDNRKYFNLEDLLNSKNIVDEFMYNHYPCKYVEKNFFSYRQCEKYGLERIKPPNHYNGLILKHYNHKANTKFFEKDEVDKFRNKIETSSDDKKNSDVSITRKEELNLLDTTDELNKYIDSKMLAKMLEKTSLKHFDIELFISEFRIRTISKSNDSYKFHLDDVNNAVEELRTFFKNHYFTSDAVKMIDRSILDKHNLKRYDVPKHYVGLLAKSFNTKSKTKVYKKSEIDELLKRKELHIKEKEAQKKADVELQSQIESGELITGAEASRRLSITMESLAKLRKLDLISYRTNSFGVAGGIYYSSREVDSLLEKRNNFFKEYVPFGKPCNKYFNDVDFEYEFVRRTIKKDLKDYIVEVPKYCIGLSDLYGASYTYNGAVKIDALKDYIIEVNVRVEAKKEAELNRSLIGATKYETFELRLTNLKNWEGFKPHSEYTKTKMFTFIREYFDKSRMKEENVSSNITTYINVAFTIKDMLDRHKVEEIYLLSSSQINLYIKTIPNVTTQDIVYRFLSEVNQDLMKLGLTSRLKFDFSKIKKPSEGRETVRNVDKDIYNFEIYSSVFKYLVDINKHIPIILEEYNKTKTVVHASIWLYSILHLNNAWRNGDCNRFPDLDINDLLQEFGISSMDWFVENELTLPQAKAIVFKVRQWEMRISKTTMKGAFFCSDELSPAFATAVIILTLFKHNHGITITGESDEVELIMNFDSEWNTVNSTMLKNFFAPAEIKGFEFKSRKFNRSIMTYIYYLANLRGDAKALTFVAELRSHVNEENSLFYIDFDMNKIDSMTNQLFQRGEFGYIPELLSQKLLSKSGDGSFEETTKRILQINAVFGDVNNINNTSRFLNVIRHDRQTVIDMISEKSFEECQKYLTDIFTMNLPSKDGSDIQCLFGANNCQRPDLSTDDDKKVSCFDCCYHIPSIYALSRLCISIIECYKDYFSVPKNIKTKDVKDYLITNEDKVSKITKKHKLQLGMQIFRRKVLLEEALDKFGAEYLFRCLNLDGDDFVFISDFMTVNFYEQFPELLPLLNK